MHVNREATGQRGLRVVAQNVWAHFGAWPERRAVLIDGLRGLAPDLAAFVEPIKRDDYDQTVDLLGPGYHVVYQAERDPAGIGVSIASRWPLGAIQEVDLHVSPRLVGFYGSTIVAEVLAPEPLGPLLFVGVSRSWEMGRERERELQALATERVIEQVLAGRRMHVVLAGDFDARPDAASIRFLTGRQSLEGVSVCYRDAWASVHGNEPGYTFTPRNRLVAEGETAWDIDRRIDYVFVRCDDHGPTLDVAACSLAFDRPRDGVWASDDFGVVADLTLPPVAWESAARP
jgi:endonuclease/exonuclease/phosphatase family metal-dependent hydrolase